VDVCGAGAVRPSELHFGIGGVPPFTEINPKRSILSKDYPFLNDVRLVDINGDGLDDLVNAGSVDPQQRSLLLDRLA